jgi:multisubunit Na+/H+ antiporter MnhB subunit
MPVIALAVVLFLSSFDKAPSFFGAPRSPTRTVVAGVLVTMMLLGVLGLTSALDWLAKGEPSEQFTRTRWFQRRRAPG